MKASEMILQLQQLDPDTDVTTFMRLYDGRIKKKLNFDEAGRAIRLLVPILGKPFLNYNHDTAGKALTCRVVNWRAQQNPEKFVVASEKMFTAGLSCWITGSGYFTIHIPFHAYITSYYTSDDPKVWMELNEKKIAQVNKNHLAKIQRKAAADKAWEEKWKAEQKERELQKMAEEAQRAIEESARIAKIKAAKDEAQTKLMKLQEQPTRSINILQGE